MEAYAGQTVLYIPANNATPLLAKIALNYNPTDNTPGPAELHVQTWNGTQVKYNVPYSANATTGGTWTFLGAEPADPAILKAAATAIITKLTAMLAADEKTAFASTGNDLRAAMGVSARTLP